MTVLTYIIIAYFSLPLIYIAISSLFADADWGEKIAKAWEEVMTAGGESISPVVRSLFIALLLATMYVFWPAMEVYCLIYPENGQNKL